MAASVPRLSIVIPVLDGAPRLETTLVSVLENRPADCEIIAVLTAPYDDPYDLAGEVRFVELEGRKGLAAGINEGIEASRAAIVHVLSAGLEVAEGWTDAAIAHFKDPRVASVSPLVVDVLDGRTLAAGLAYSCRRGRMVRGDALHAGDTAVQDSGPTVSRQERVRDRHAACDQPQSVEILGPLLQAGFYRRSALELVGGFPHAVGDCTADADLAFALLYAGYKCILDPRSIVLATPAEVAPARAGFSSGLAAEQLFWRAAPVVGWTRSLLAHPLGVLGEFVRALPRPGAVTALLGRLVGVCQMRSHRAHHQWLLDVQRAAAALFRAARPQNLRIDAAHEERSRARGKEARVAPRTAA